MPDRRPVLLTEEQAKIIGDLLSAHVQGYSAELDAVVDPVLEQIGDDPVPWLTVDDNGQAVRMAAWGTGSAHGDPVQLYRAVLRRP